MGSAIIRVEEVEYVFENEDKATMTVGLYGKGKVIVPLSEGMQIAMAVKKNNAPSDNFYKGALNEIRKIRTPEDSRAQQRVSQIRGEILRDPFSRG